ncbi:single-stranded DNA-binding protein [Desulfonema ishimotonii]|uniref:Single-stranded DNA-binding protein n=1 Tax=Desulfonema ishimotonii TaxID=45657 RepID=A0A401FWB7_9BACT|nr:uracil-DNA glycosylase family protein [Desulfonema ishimotonii]GBC61265.1 single-stranded DNA-binding protein [Desulfonema ishimotonii]
MTIDNTIDALVRELSPLRFGPPVSHVYNPLEYARKSHDLYLHQYGKSPKTAVLMGMNPGPWGMAQTGVPFGEVGAVRDWLDIEAPVGTPAHMHPKRPIEGFACEKSEVSGRRLWGWAKERFVTPDRFFSQFFVANYCPLVFMEESGRNRTPDKLPKAEKKLLFAICDQALRETVEYLQPRYVVGVGVFAESRAKAALKGMDVIIGRITHPSPANPRANRGWAELAEKELGALGIGGVTDLLQN